MDQRKIGEFIKSCRKEKNITQKEIADKLYVTDKTISRWENGHYLPDLSLWKELCEILGISMLELMNGEKMNNHNITKKEMEESVYNTVDFTSKKMKKMKKKTITIIFISILIVFGTIIAASAFVKNNKEKYEPITFSSRYASIKKEDGWVCSFVIYNYPKDKVYNNLLEYYHYDCENLKYDFLYDYQSTIEMENGDTYKSRGSWVSYVWSDKYSNDTYKISEYFNNKKFNKTITLDDLSDLKLETDIDKSEIVNLYNIAYSSKKSDKFGPFIDFQPVKVQESMTINNYTWTFGYKVNHGYIVDVYINVKYNNKWLDEIDDLTLEQKEILDNIDIIEKYIIDKQSLILPKKYQDNRLYNGLIEILNNTKKIDYND